jgi:sec-independent protein translocase protein TatA
MNLFPSLIAWMPSGGEWVVILIIVLLLFGAKRLPELARSLGKAKNEFQKGAREINEEINKDSSKSNGDGEKKS